MQCSSGEGHVTKAFWKAKGAVILANVEDTDRTLVNDNGGGGGTFPVRLRMHGCSTGVHLPSDVGGDNWASRAAHEA